MTKSYAVLWENEIGPGPNFQFNPYDNQLVVHPYMEGGGGTFTMYAVIYPQKQDGYNMNDYEANYEILDYGCTLNICDFVNYQMIIYGSIIYGPYNGTEYADSPSFQSITYNGSPWVYIQTHYCGGSVWFEW